MIQFIFRHIREPIEFAVFDSLGDKHKFGENGTAVGALKDNTIDTIFPSISRPNFSLALQEQNEMSRNISYVFVHEVRCIRSFEFQFQI